MLFRPHKDMKDKWWLNAGTTTETEWTWKTIHIIHSLILTKRIWEVWLWWPSDIRRPCGPLAFWHLSYRWGKTPKNLTQETCPDRGSNPSLLRDRRACYRLLHSGGLEEVCPYINHFSDILRFLSVSYKIMTIPIVFSFGVCCLSAHATT